MVIQIRYSPPSVCLHFVIKAEKISDQYADAVGALIDDSSVSADKVWSSEKVNNSTIPYVLIDTTKDIDFNEYTETGYYTPNKSFSTGWFTHSILNAPTDGWLPAGDLVLKSKHLITLQLQNGSHRYFIHTLVQTMILLLYIQEHSSMTVQKLSSHLGRELPI